MLGGGIKALKYLLDSIDHMSYVPLIPSVNDSNVPSQSQPRGY